METIADAQNSFQGATDRYSNSGGAHDSSGLPPLASGQGEHGQDPSAPHAGQKRNAPGTGGGSRNNKQARYSANSPDEDTSDTQDQSGSSSQDSGPSVPPHAKGRARSAAAKGGKGKRKSETESMPTYPPPRPPEIGSALAPMTVEESVLEAR